MFGKSSYQLSTSLSALEVLASLEEWSGQCGLRDLSSKLDDEARKLYRFGSPFVSNPIYFEISLGESSIEINGYVQTWILFVPWKFVDPPGQSWATEIDYRRKGGLLVSRLREALAEKAKG